MRMTSALGYSCLRRSSDLGEWQIRRRRRHSLEMMGSRADACFPLAQVMTRRSVSLLTEVGFPIGIVTDSGDYEKDVDGEKAQWLITQVFGLQYHIAVSGVPTDPASDIESKIVHSVFES